MPSGLQAMLPGSSADAGRAKTSSTVNCRGRAPAAKETSPAAQARTQAKTRSDAGGGIRRMRLAGAGFTALAVYRTVAGKTLRGGAC